VFSDVVKGFNPMTAACFPDLATAKEGKWVAVERNQGQILGLDVIVKKGFGYATEHQGRMFLLPSVSYIVYCQERL